MPGSGPQMPRSAVTSQPLPFGRLEREKHIQMLFRAFHRPGGPATCDHQDSPEDPQQGGEGGPGDQGSRLDLLRRSTLENGHHGGQPPLGQTSRSGMGDQWSPSGGGGGGGGGDGGDSVAMLDTVSQLHITARTALQGLQCVPRRIYSIATGSSREQLFVAVEESSCLCLQCCGPARSCSLQGFNQQGCQVFHFERPLRADACCLGCCLMEIRAYTPQKHLIGSIHQKWSMFTPLLEVCDSEGTSSIRIQGDCCPCRCLSNQEFQLVSMIGERIGSIWKKWPGFNDECNMDHEYFGLEVPLNMDSNTKLLLLAATFLLNHMFFEMS